MFQHCQTEMTTEYRDVEETLENAGYECSTMKYDLGSKENILKLVEFATSKGDVMYVVNAAGVSPSQAPVAEILRVDLYGTSVLLEEFGKVIAEGGSGVFDLILHNYGPDRLVRCTSTSMTPCRLTRSTVLRVRSPCR